jgi:alanyl aminopeptidase
MLRRSEGLCALVLVSCGAAPSPPAEPAPARPPPPVAARLPAEPPPLGPLARDVRPTRETLALEIDPESDRFGGAASIDLVIDRPRDVLWLHGRGFAVASCTVAIPTGEQVGCSWSEVDPTGVAKVTLDRPISGAATLRLRYEAPYDASLVGIYRTALAGGGHAVFSKFEAIYARRGFPCFDEPSFKVPFDVSLTVPKGTVALSNGSPASSSDGGRTETVTFAPTPPLPTYLVAFAVGPFAARPSSVPPSAVRAFPVPVQTIALRGREAETAFIASEAPAIVAEEERYFGEAFPFSKLDLLAAPDTQSGAMENAGLIIFRDSALLVDPKAATLGQRIGVLNTTAHEIAHQWFGDLVTMNWWDDLWLNESFATFLATRTMKAVKPELEADLLEVSSTGRVMEQDGLASARQIRQPIRNTDDITNAFDGITYSKGQAVLTMVERYVGEEAFRRGLHEYLHAHAGGNATTDDLVAALSTASGKDLTAVFASFLDQPGVPLVTVHAACEGGKGSLSLAERRWLPLGSKAAKNLTWNVPVCVSAGVGGKVEAVCGLLDGKGTTLPLASGCADWVMPNVDARGYYRFALDAEGFGRLRDRGVRHLGVRERLALAGDIDAVFHSATLGAGDALRTIEPLARDSHGAVATAPLGLYRFVSENLLDGALSPRFRAYLQRLYSPAARSLGWRASRGESTWRALERAAVLSFLALRMDDGPTLAEGARFGRDFLGLGPDGKAHPDAVDPDLLGLALSSAMRLGDARVFDAVVLALTKSEDAPKRRTFLGALASTRDPALASRALDLTLRPDLRKAERLTALATLLDAPATRALAWTWLLQHFDALVPLLPDRYAGFVPGLVHFCDAARADELEAFFAPRMPNLTGGTRNLAQAVEAMRGCAALADAQRASAVAFAKKL